MIVFKIVSQKFIFYVQSNMCSVIIFIFKRIKLYEILNVYKTALTKNRRLKWYQDEECFYKDLTI